MFFRTYIQYNALHCIDACKHTYIHTCIHASKQVYKNAHTLGAIDNWMLRNWTLRATALLGELRPRLGDGRSGQDHVAKDEGEDLSFVFQTV